MRGKLAIHFFDFFFYEIFAAHSLQSVLRGRAVCIIADGCAKNRQKKIRCAKTYWFQHNFFAVFIPLVRDLLQFLLVYFRTFLKPYVCVIRTLRISCVLPTCGRYEIDLGSGFDVRSGRARPEEVAGKWAFWLKRAENKFTRQTMQLYVPVERYETPGISI